MPQLNDEVQHRWPTVEGPLPGPIGEWLAVLPCLNTNGTLVRAMQRVSPVRAQLARAIAESLGNGGRLPETPDLALDQVWAPPAGDGVDVHEAAFRVNVR